MIELIVGGVIGVAIGSMATIFVVKQDHHIIHRETWQRMLQDNASLRSKVAELSGFVYEDGDIEVELVEDVELVLKTAPVNERPQPPKTRAPKTSYPGFYPPQQNGQPKSKT